MDVKALDPHFDQTEEAAQFFTVFADAVSCRNDSFELDWPFERARSPDGASELPLKHLLYSVSTNERLPDHLMIDGILCIELCHCVGVGTVECQHQFLINSRGSMVVIILTFGETSTAVQDRKRQVAEFPESATFGR